MRPTLSVLPVPSTALSVTTLTLAPLVPTKVCTTTALLMNAYLVGPSVQFVRTARLVRPVALTPMSLLSWEKVSASAASWLTALSVSHQLSARLAFLDLYLHLDYVRLVIR